MACTSPAPQADSVVFGEAGAGWELYVRPVPNAGLLQKALQPGEVLLPLPLSEHPSSIHLARHENRKTLKSPGIWAAFSFPATLSSACIHKTRKLIAQTLHKEKQTVPLWNHRLYFPVVEQGSNLPTHGVAVSCDSTNTAADIFRPLNILFLAYGGTGEFAASHLLKYNSLQNIKQMHSALCRHIITLCVHIRHICSTLAVHLVNVWETPWFKASSVSFVL